MVETDGLFENYGSVSPRFSTYERLHWQGLHIYWFLHQLVSKGSCHRGFFRRNRFKSHFQCLFLMSDSKDKEQNDGENQAERKKSKKHKKRKLDSEFGVVRGIDFKNVYTVINFDMPATAAGYVHRIGRTGRAYNIGQSISIVSPHEMEIFDEIKLFLGENEEKDLTYIAPFPLLEKNAVEFLRYRAEF